MMSSTEYNSCRIVCTIDAWEIFLQSIIEALLNANEIISSDLNPFWCASCVYVCMVEFPIVHNDDDDGGGDYVCWCVCLKHIVLC